VLKVLSDLGRDLADRQHEVDHSGAHGAAHHAVVFGALLGDGKAARLLDGAQPERAVAAGARQDDSGRALAACLGQRLEEAVDRCALAAYTDWRPLPQPPMQEWKA